MNVSFWRGKRVFVTGHTGFKGSWLSLWLMKMGANVYGYSLTPSTEPSMYAICKLNQTLAGEVIADVRDLQILQSNMSFIQPDVVFHLAAQPLVRDSYRFPVDTFSTNMMGTVNVLEAVRNTPSVLAVVNVTTDKCYLNKGVAYSYREEDRLGGNDPYSASKAASELITTAYRSSYFANSIGNRLNVATARAGNVIGGGDWSRERLVPDIVNAIITNQPLSIRNPAAVRPWQHVLDPLRGYLMLAEQLSGENGSLFAEAWNFGPSEREQFSVKWLAEKVYEDWRAPVNILYESHEEFREESYINLNHQKALEHLRWEPTWDLPVTLSKVVDWYKAYYAGDDMQEFTSNQIEAYERAITI